MAHATREMPHSEGGPCCAVVGEEDDGSPQLCGETWSTCWYGKKGKKFCAFLKGKKGVGRDLRAEVHA